MAKESVLIVLVVLLAVVFQEVISLNCWRCSTDATNSEFCGDPFNSTALTEKQMQYRFVDCSFPPGQEWFFGQSRPVCKRVRQKVNNTTVISRSCTYEKLDTKPNACQDDSSSSNGQIEFCETCSTDGCNSATTVNDDINSRSNFPRLG